MVIISAARRSVVLNISEKSIKSGRTVAGDDGAWAEARRLSPDVDRESGELVSEEADASELV